MPRDDRNGGQVSPGFVCVSTEMKKLSGNLSDRCRQEDELPFFFFYRRLQESGGFQNPVWTGGLTGREGLDSLEQHRFSVFQHPTRFRVPREGRCQTHHQYLELEGSRCCPLGGGGG